ncbi:hypothetical protein CEW87_18030 [Parazoarcus communis]|uniref:TRAP transporter small permease protein n=1 Tax=Parazoarcus communis TaxID=41977 RepID=A0A2U8H5K3_9RHOO|nr:TRAP transporter small permease [Parazoarcus communis]AWI81091.1 hypothetical protein CEW87_18030 [Parazoarcus communis]
MAHSEVRIGDSIEHPLDAQDCRSGGAIETACVVFAMIGGLIFAAESIMCVVSVVGRALFNLPIPGDYELVQMMSAMGISMCLPYCQVRKGHVFVDFFTLWAPSGLKRVLDALSALLLSVCSFFLAWRVLDGMMEMREYGETSMVISLSVWWGYIPVVPSFALLGIAALRSAWSDLNNKRQS